MDTTPHTQPTDHRNDVRHDRRHSGRSRRRITRPLLPAALRALILIAVISPVTLAQQGTTGVQVVGTLSRDISVAAGTASVHIVRLRNTGSDAAYARVLFRPITLPQQNPLGDSPAEAEARDNSAWISGPGGPVLIPAHSTVTVEFTVETPEGAAGSYWAALVVRPEEYLEQPVAVDGVQTAPIRFMSEYVGLMYTHVSGTGLNLVSFGAPAVELIDSSAHLTVSLTNTGDRADMMDIRADFMRADGTLAGHFTTRARVNGGHERQLALPLANLEAGEYTVILVADAGLHGLFGHQATVTVP